MTRTLTLSLIVLLCATTFTRAQEQVQEQLPRIAVYVTGNVPDDNFQKTLGAHILASLVNSGLYISVEHTDALGSVMKNAYNETTLDSGGISDNRISEIGKLFGVKYICIIEIAWHLDTYEISTRMVNIENATAANFGKITSDLKNEDKFMEAVGKITDSILNGTAVADPELAQEHAATESESVSEPELAQESTVADAAPESMSAPALEPMQETADVPKSFAITPIEKEKLSPLVLTARWSGVALAVGGFVGGLYYNNQVRHNEKKYNESRDYNTVRQLRNDLDHDLSIRTMCYILAGIGAGAFTVTLFF